MNLTLITVFAILILIGTIIFVFKIKLKLTRGLIICDTNIFYGIIRGDVPTEQFKTGNFVLTHLTVFEFGTSHTVHRICDELKQAAAAAKKYSGKFIVEDPFDFALQRFFPDYKPNQGRIEEMKKKLEELILINCSQVDIAQAKILLDVQEKPFEDEMDKINAKWLNAPALAKGDRNFIHQSDATVIFKPQVAEMLAHHYKLNTGKEIIIPLDHDGWKELELFLHVYVDFHKLLRTETGRKFKINDWWDIWMMAYTGRRDKYYTKEKKWIKIIQDNPITQKYLYQET